MPRKATATAVMIITLWLCRSTGVAQEKFQHGWGVEPIDASAFKLAVDQLRSAAKPPPLKSIKAGLQFSSTGIASYGVTISLPGAEECKIDPRPLIGPVYPCSTHVADEGLAIKAKQELAKALDSSIKGLELETPGSSDYRHYYVSGMGANFLLFHDPDFNEWVIRVDKRFGSSYVEMWLIPHQNLLEWRRSLTTLSTAPSRDVNAAPYEPNANTKTFDVIRDQVDAIESSGRYARMPAPQAVPLTTNSVAPGAVQRTFENGTAYNVTVLMTGPMNQEVRLAPGEKKLLTIPAGIYKVAARTSAPNILPFFGVQTYSSGYSYQSHFYIQ